MKNFYFLILTMSLITSCNNISGNAQSSATGKPAIAETKINIPYGKDSMQKMDIHLPAGRSTDSTKTIVLIHGGGWTGGDKKDFATHINILKERLPDYAFVNVNYRLATTSANHFPTQENDIQAVINFLYDKKDEYKISGEFVLLGASAGAHLALLHTYKHTKPVKIKAVISFFGPSDLEEIYNTQTNSFYQYALGILIGGPSGLNKKAFDQSNPIFFANKNSSPTLLLHGGRDRLVPSSQSEVLYSKLKDAGVPTELVIYPTEGHGWIGKNLTNSFDRIEAFIKEHVQ